MYLPCAPEWHFTHHRKAFLTVTQICVHLNILQVFYTRPPGPLPLGSSSWLCPRATVPVGCSSAPPSTDLLHPEFQWCWSLLVPPCLFWKFFLVSFVSFLFPHIFNIYWFWGSAFLTLFPVSWAFSGGAYDLSGLHCFLNARIAHFCLCQSLTFLRSCVPVP